MAIWMRPIVANEASGSRRPTWHRDRDGGVTARPNADFEHRFRRCSQIGPCGETAPTASTVLVFLFNDLGSLMRPEVCSFSIPARGERRSPRPGDPFSRHRSLQRVSRSLSGFA